MIGRRNTPHTRKLALRRATPWPATAEQKARITAPGAAADLSTLNLMQAFTALGEKLAPLWLTDGARHLVCHPYGLPELHAMATALDIHRGFFHQGKGGRLAHYDIPEKRTLEIEARCLRVRPRDIVAVIHGGVPEVVRAARQAGVTSA